MYVHIGLFVLGLALLAAGGGFLAFATAALARRYGASAFVAGLIAVGFGTASAALAFDLSAVARERMRLAVGTIVGVNVTHIGLALGVAALVRPIAGMSRVVSGAIPVLIGGTLLFWFIGRDNAVSQLGGGVLVVAFVAAVVYLSGLARQEPEVVREEFEVRVAGPAWAAWVLAGLGVMGLVTGGALAVTVIGEIARPRGIKALEFGATAVAFGVSLPGLVAAVVASRRDRPDAALGVVLASGICNVLLVTGVTALATPVLSREPVMLVDTAAVMNQIPAMAAFSLLLLTVLFNRLEVSRWQGGIFLAGYAGFVAWQMV